jgi:hypothetical protein
MTMRNTARARAFRPRRGRLVHPAARARDRVTVVLNHLRAQWHLDHLPRPGDAKVSGVREITAAPA